VVRQLLVEGAILAVAGSLAGVWIAWFGSEAIAGVIVARASGPDAAVAALEVAPNARVFGFTVLIAVVTTLIFGVVPAWRASATPPTVAASPGRVAETHGRLASSLIAAQVSLSLILVIGAGLFTRSLHNLRAVDRGFTPGNVLLARFDPRRAGLSSPELRAFNQSVLRTVETLPGVGAASLAAVTPLQGGGMSTPMSVNGVSTDPAEVYFNIISPKFFEIVGTPLVSGRDISDADDAKAPPVAVVNEVFVRLHVTGGSPLGQRLKMTPQSPEMQIVGVVKDAVYETLREAPPATVYASYLQTRGRPMTLVIDSRGQLNEVSASVRAAIQPKAPATPMRIEPFAAQVESSLFQARLMRSLSAIFGGLALALAAVGLYGLMSCMVAMRTREIGIRLALGASPAHAIGMVLGKTLRMVAIGIGVGLPIALLSSRLVQGLIFGLKATDAATIAASGLLLVTVAMAAAALPARRAARLDPVRSIQAE
jgi:predicted permease